MDICILEKPSMTSIEIAELVGSRPDNVKISIERLAKSGVIQLPALQVFEKINNLGLRRSVEAYVFEGEQGKRDSIIVVAQLSPEFTARLVDRWRELEEQARQPLTEIEMIAAMAANAVQQQKRLHVVESKVSQVVETVEQIKKGNMPEGYIGYRQLAAKCGLTEAKCRNLVNAYRIPTDTHEFLTPEGVLSRRSIVALSPFMNAFNRMMSEAEHRGKRWYHPKMGQFQVIGWGGE
ncbi:DNA-binding protein [Salmonella enterica subsp. enterica serovar Infantis]|jgi:phage regulator Rha-like protein|uniref:Rha family transcriptional regulator n=1 Tax=Enterobacteriaceae TaxID=543 RepID=UPI000D57BD96|nr:MULTISPECIES: Rha family transcriptional regulator [Enterobacteriaceae]EAV5121083.1 DNA-binding protein [Salmonella enterica]ECB3996120.1 DNA-binding protein [Salmonella enterica subsp. enterica serovar Mbandaka]EDU8832026.1 DNA-binding protein [Salmonella enterica subsp. enterica]EHQ1797643.1 Rha family transcriptional regulator [Salmonella enterica subsp. enterica serovar Hartford]HBZ1665707.1 Rha family transcriptional regulator [Salmonella enterica subsp. enterica serovar Rissen]